MAFKRSGVRLPLSPPALRAAAQGDPKPGSSAQMPLPFSLARTLPRSPLRSDNGHRNRDGSLCSPIPSSLRSSLRLPFARPYDSPYLHQDSKTALNRCRFCSSWGDKGSAALMTCFSRQSGCTRLRLDTFRVSPSPNGNRCKATPPLIWFHHLPKDPIVRVFFLSSRADGGDNESAPPMTRFSRQSGCTRLRLDTFVSRHSLTAIAVAHAARY